MYKSLVEFQRGNSIGKVMAFNGTQILEKILLVEQTWGLPGGAGGKKKTLPAVQEIRDTDLIPGSGRSPGVRNSSWLQYSCLKNSMERGIWQAAVHGAAESQTQPSDEHSTHTGICTRKQFTYKWALMPSCKMGTLF